MKISILILILFSLSFGTWRENPPISIGAISYVDARWDNNENMLLARQTVTELTNDGISVVLYFFEACFT